ncbi:response regulator [Actinomycetota bacterium]|jgi:DNA-binding NarL/FixJ family response regulator
MTTVFLVDDHPAVRAGTRSFLGDFDIVGEADNATDAVTGILATRPDVALIDVHLDVPQGGAQVVAAVKEAAPEVKCVAFTVSTSRADVAALLAAGVDGYLVKSTDAEELPRAVVEVMDGGTPVSREVASFMLEIDSIGEQIERLKGLTPREREVVTSIAKGYTYRETAAKLGMKVKTLETHMSHIFEKLGVATRAELSFLAYETGIVDPRDGRNR